MIVGRDAERGVIGRLLGDAARSRGRLLQVVGAPGTGKTAMVASVLADVGEHSDIGVVHVRAAPGEADIAWAGLSAVVAALRDALAELPERPRSLLDGLVGWGPAQQGDDVATGMAFLALLIAASRERPVVLVVDDERWLDPESRRTIDFVARRIDGQSIALLVITTLRNQALSRLGDTVELGDLDHGSAVALVRSHGVAHRVALDVVERCGTRPLVLVEAVSRLSTDQRTGAVSLPSPLPTGSTIEADFAVRVSALPASSRRALLVLAVAGVDDGWRALASSEIGDAELVPAERSGLVELTPEGPLFVHPLVAAAVVASAPDDEKRAACRLVAAALDGVDPHRSRWYRARATVGPDEALAGELEAIAETAGNTGRAYDALRMWGQAAVVGTAGAVRSRRWLRAADAALQARLTDAAASLVDRSRADDAEARLLRARVAQARGDLMSARGEFIGVALDQGAPPHVRSAAQVDAAVLSMRMYDIVTTSSLTEPAVREGYDPPTRRRLELLHVAARAAFGDPASVAALVDSTTAALAEPTSARELQHLAEACALALARAGRQPELHALGESLMRRANEGGVPTLVLPLLIAQAASLGRRDLVAALHAAASAVALIEEWNHDEYLVFALTHRANALAGLGDEGALDDADRIEAYGGPLANGAATVVRAAFHRTRGDFESVVVCSEDAHRRAGRQPPLSVMWHLDLFEAALKTGRRELALDVRETLLASLERTGSSWVRAGLERADGLLSDDHDRAVEHLERSASVFEAGDYLINAARSEMLLAGWLIAHGAAERGAERARSARSRFEAAGMRTWMSWCDELVSGVSGASGRDDQFEESRRNDDRSVASLVLSPRELQVARWIVDGYTYREIAERLFVSQRTVESHAQSVYRKLAVRGRRGLATRALTDSTLRAAHL